MTGIETTRYPPWVVLHVPHDADWIPTAIVSQFILDEASLRRELILMTDHRTYDLFKAGDCADQAVRAEVSRLVVDVERFADDAQEPMSSRGMGVIYTQTAHRTPLRRTLSAAQRRDLLDRYYHPHQERLSALVDSTLSRYGHCLLLDCHSFPSHPLPYEPDQTPDRPDICIGTDGFHTPDSVKEAFVQTFTLAGFTVRINSPFAGALVPIKHYLTEARVAAIMVEVNRGLYLDEATGKALAHFEAVSAQIAVSCQHAARIAAETPC